MSQPTGDDSKPSETEHSFKGYRELPLSEWVMTDEDREELAIQERMYREADRAVREEVAWLEEHNFPIWIYHEGEVIDARTLSDEVRAKLKGPKVDLSRPKMLLVPIEEEPEAG